MSVKPAEFYVGLHDFFALLLPGALLTFWLSPVLLRALDGVALHGAATTGVGAWIAFLLASFFVGQVLFSIAAMLDFFGDWFADRRVLASETAIQNELPGMPQGKLRHVGAAWLRVNCPNAMPDIDRLMALSKFYRSLVVVLLLMVFGYFGKPQDSVASPRWIWLWEVGWRWAALMIPLTLAAFVAYVFYRTRHRKAVVLYLQIVRP